MNYFCHAFLCDQSPAILAGTIGGDAVKGSIALNEMPEPYRSAVREHRLVDELCRDLKSTDWLREKLPENLRRYTGIYSDLLFDYLLMQHWTDFTRTEINARLQYASNNSAVHSPQEYYQLVESRLNSLDEEMPEILRRKLEPIRKYKLMLACGTPEGLREILFRISSRFKRFPPPVTLDHGLDCFLPFIGEIEDTMFADLRYLQAGLLELSGESSAG